MYTEIECEGDVYGFSAEISEHQESSEHFGQVAWHTESDIANVVLTVNDEIVEDVPALIYERLENRALLNFKYGDEA